MKNTIQIHRLVPCGSLCLQSNEKTADGGFSSIVIRGKSWAPCVTYDTEGEKEPVADKRQVTPAELRLLKTLPETWKLLVAPPIY